MKTFSKNILAIFLLLNVVSNNFSFAMKREHSDLEQNQPHKKQNCDQMDFQEQSALCVMPPDVLLYINSFLTKPSDVAHLSQTCKLMHNGYQVQNQVYSLKIENWMLTPEKFPHLLDFIANKRCIQYLDVSKTDIIDDQLVEILNVNNGRLRETLISLNLGNCSNLIDFNHLANMQNLQYLSLSHNKIINKQLANILNGKLKETLISLGLDFCILLKDFICLVDMQNLQHLNLTFTEITNEQLANISNGRLKETLISLDLGFCLKLTDFSCLKEMQTLQYLCLRNCKITYDQLVDILNKLKETLTFLVPIFYGWETTIQLTEEYPTIKSDITGNFS